MKDLPPSTYWMGVKYKIPSIQGAAKPLIYARKIPSIDEEPKLKLKGDDMIINELFDALFATSLPRMAGRCAGFLLNTHFSALQ